jgi:hypothetical protein
MDIIIISQLMFYFSVLFLPSRTTIFIASSIPLDHSVVFTDTNFQAHTGGKIRRHIPLQQPTSPIKHGDVPGGRHLSADWGIITFERGMFLVLLVVISSTPSEVRGISLIEKAQGEIVAMKSKDTIRTKLTFLLSISLTRRQHQAFNSLAK